MHGSWSVKEWIMKRLSGRSKTDGIILILIGILVLIILIPTGDGKKAGNVDQLTQEETDGKNTAEMRQTQTDTEYTKALEELSCDVTAQAKLLAEKFWPGPLTMILKKSDCVPKSITGGLGTVAIRMPSHPAAQKLIEYSGGYIAAPSANTSGKPSPTVAKYVVEDMMGRIDAIIDGGEVGIGLESTIIDLTVSPPQILRPGYITREKLSTVLGTVDTDATILRADSGQAPKAPGMKYRHYAPRGELTIVEGTPEQVREYINREAAADHAAGEKTGIIGTEEMLSGYTADVVKSVGSRRDEDSIARHLYTILREFDDEGVTKIYSEGFSTDGFGQAIMNRLLKAAGHKVVKL